MRKTLLEQIVATSQSALSALSHGRYSTYGKKLAAVKTAHPSTGGTGMSNDYDRWESVREQWRMECPKCHSDEAIHISATQRLEVRLCVGGTDQEGGDTEWEDDDAAWCTDCGFQGVVKDFQLKEESHE